MVLSVPYCELKRAITANIKLRECLRIINYVALRVRVSLNRRRAHLERVFGKYVKQRLFHP
jgi:hypothetical protein